MASDIHIDGEEKDSMSCSEESSCESHQQKPKKVSTRKKTFQCEICNKMVSSKTSLKNHVAMHIGLKEFKCHICSKEFYERHKLNKHLQIHAGLREFKCHICSNGYFRKHHLDTHLKAHTGLKEFKCHVCWKEFYEKGDLTKHLRSHTELKEFKCHICNKDFKLNYTLKKHMKAHTENKDFMCHVCSKAYHHKFDLTRHLRTHMEHEEFKCHICNKEFKAKCSLNRHLKYHDASRDFKCKFCHRAYKHRVSLKKHIAYHAEELEAKVQLPENKKAFKQNSLANPHLKECSCLVCDDEFSNEYYLQQHMQKHSDQMIDVQSSLSSMEDVDKTASESDPYVDPLLIEVERPTVVKEEVPDSTLSEMTRSHLNRKDLVGNECLVKTENDKAHLDNDGFQINFCGTDDVVDDIVKEEKFYDDDHELS